MTPRPLTLQTASTYEEWAAKLKETIDASQRPRIIAMIAQESENDPQFAKGLQTLIDGSGDANEILTAWAASRPVEAARLHRATMELPMTIAALRLAIECILATCQEPEKVDADSVTYEEARAYCAKILEMTT